MLRGTSPATRTHSEEAVPVPVGNRASDRHLEMPAALRRQLERGPQHGAAVPASWIRLSFDGGADALRKLRNGDGPTIEAFVGAYWPVVEREADHYRRRGGAEDDLRSEGALALWEAARSHDSARHASDFDTYVRNVVHQRVRRVYRKAMGFESPSEVPLDWAAGMSAVERRYEGVELRADLDAAVDRLPAGERRAWRAYLDLAERGVGLEQAARNLAAAAGGSPAAWKKRLQRGRRKLRRWM